MRERARADGTVAYQVLFRHGGRQRSETFTTAAGQRRFHRNVERLGVAAALEILNAADDAEAEMPTLAEQIAHHIDGLSGVTEGTIRRYRSIAARIGQQRLGQLPLDAITDVDVAKWVRSQEQAKRAGKTIRNEHSLISAALSRAVREEKVRLNVAKGVRIGRSERAEMTILLPHEFLIVYSRIPAEFVGERALARFLYGTGARFGEAAALQVRDHRKAETPPTISIVRAWKYTSGAGYEVGPPKTHMGRRTVSLPTEVHADLLELAKGKAPGDWLFTTARGEPIRHQRFWELWRSWCDDEQHDGPRLGKSPRVHDLRHSHASWLIGRGMNMLDLQHRLGHEDIGTTAGTYGHLLPEAQAQAARLSDGLFDGPPALDPA